MRRAEIVAGLLSQITTTEREATSGDPEITAKKQALVQIGAVFAQILRLDGVGIEPIARTTALPLPLVMELVRLADVSEIASYTGISEADLREAAAIPVDGAEVVATRLADRMFAAIGC